jgi:hypothetical protein
MVGISASYHVVGKAGSEIAEIKITITITPARAPLVIMQPHFTL